MVKGYILYEESHEIKVKRNGSYISLEIEPDGNSACQERIFETFEEAADDVQRKVIDYWQGFRVGGSSRYCDAVYEVIQEVLEFDESGNVEEYGDILWTSEYPDEVNHLFGTDWVKSLEADYLYEERWEDYGM